MIKPKKPKPPKPKPQRPSGPPPSTPQNPPERNWWAWSAGAIALIASVFGIILFADWARDQFAKLTPEFESKESGASSQTPPSFIIKNPSPYFTMGGNVQLVCIIDSAAFDLNGKIIGFAMPVTTGRSNLPIPPGGTAEYRCDPAAYMKIENGGISLLGLSAKMPDANGATLKLADATVRVGIKYLVAGFSKEAISEAWKLEREPTYHWVPVRPMYQ